MGVEINFGPKAEQAVNALNEKLYQLNQLDLSLQAELSSLHEQDLVQKLFAAQATMRKEQRLSFELTSGCYLVEGSVGLRATNWSYRHQNEQEMRSCLPDELITLLRLSFPNGDNSTLTFEEVNSLLSNAIAEAITRSAQILIEIAPRTIIRNAPQS